MRNQIFTLLLCAIAVQGADAKVRTTSQMIGEAARVLATKGNSMKAKSAGELKVLKREAQISIVGYENGRNVVIANDDTFKPVLAYYTANPNGKQNPALEWWMQTMNESLAEMLENGEQPDDIVLKDGYKTEVAPLLSTAWGQETPFNDQCPTYTKGGREYNYVTGCVATAMAQVLKYYQYPAKGKGSCKWVYSGDESTGTSIRVAFNTTYDWANMLNKYTGSYNEAQANAVARLMRDCGAASQMQYASDGSGSNYATALRGMRKNLRFDYASKMYHRSFNPKSVWMGMIYEELNEGRPILYAGATKDGAGHAFVFDGYDKDGLVHVEWGWDGSGDGYFDVDMLNSDQGAFSESQNMVLVRKPETTDYNEYQSMWGLGSSLDFSLNGSVLNIGKITFYNLDVDNFTGQVQLLCINTQDNTGGLLSNIGELSDVETYRGGSVSLGKVDLSQTTLKDGQYQLFFASHSTSDDTPEQGWMPMLGGDGIVSNYILTIKNGKYTLQEGNDDFSLPTGINKVTTTATNAYKDSRVYSIDGQVMGNDINAMGKGLYIVNGKKVMK